MNLAVKFYETITTNDENIQLGISPKIPAEVRFNVNIAPDDTFTIMTEESYQEYLRSIETELLNWKITQENIRNV